MRLGVLFPQTEIGDDPIAVRDFGQAADDLGYTHLLTFEHVLGVDPTTRPGWDGYYSFDAQFHEPFVLFGYLAGLTTRISFATNVMVVPQRQTALVAKQAAAVDVLSGGRLRLGVGVGWNGEEFAGLGADFHTRGARVDEQIGLLRALWTQESVTFEGRWERVQGLGIRPLPIQRPIPVWIGGASDIALDRAGRIGDGWFPVAQSPDRLRRGLERVHAAARAAGREPSDVGVDAMLWARSPAEQTWRAELERWLQAGLDVDLTFATLETGFRNASEHIDAIRRFKRLADDLVASSPR